MNQFIEMMEHGELKEIKSYYEIQHNDIFGYQTLFSFACMKGRLDVAKWILSENPDIDICFNENEAFEKACYSGNFDLVKWFLEVI